MERKGTITYEFTEEEYILLSRNLTTIKGFLEDDPFYSEEEAREAVRLMRQTLKGETE